MRQYIKKINRAWALITVLCVLITLCWVRRVLCVAEYQPEAPQQISEIVTPEPMVETPVVETPQPVIVEEEAEEPEPIVMLYNVPLDKEVQLYIVSLCEEKDISPAIILAMIETESGYRADIMGDGGNSYGLMQIQKRFFKERMEQLGVTDLLDPFQNVTVGIDFLAELIDCYGGNVEMALVAYNAGQLGAENGWFSHGIYSSDYSRKVLSTAQIITDGAYADVCPLTTTT